MAKKKTKTSTSKAMVLVSAPRPKTTKKKRKRTKKNRRIVTRGFTSAGALYIRAALDPFADIQLNGVGIPDDFGGNTLKLKQYMSITAKPDSSGTISFSAISSPTGCILANKGLYTFGLPNLHSGAVEQGTWNPATNLSDGWLGLIPFPQWAEWLATTSGATEEGGPYAFNDYRVVGQGIEIRYTGTTLNDSGLIYVAKVECQPREGRTALVPVAGTKVANNVKWVRETQIDDVGNPISSVISNVEGFRTQRVCEGAYIVMTNATGGTQFMPYDQRTIYMKQPYEGDVSGTANYTMGTWCKDTVRDPAVNIECLTSMANWSGMTPINIAIEGMETSQAVEIRIIQYLEATLQPTSAFQQFSSKSPAYDESALSTVASVQKTLPVMVPVSMNSFGDWWKKIMGVIGRIGGAVGSMGIPMVSQIAGGVGVIADTLGSFASL